MASHSFASLLKFQHQKLTVSSFTLFTLIVFNLLLFKTNGLAAKKPGGKKNVASTNKGFGAAPPTLEEVCSKFQSRMPQDPSSVPCPCGGEIYESCCAPYHRGEKFPESPLRVLQSRYSAFAFRNIPYIVSTTHPTCRDWCKDKIAWAKDLNKQGIFDSFEFVSLQVGEEVKGANNDETFLEFKVRMRSKEDDTQETTVTEKSRFLRGKDGEWAYAGGEVRSDVEGLEDAVLNQ